MKSHKNSPQLNENVVRDFLNIESQRGTSSSKDGTKDKAKSQGHSSKGFLKTLQINLTEMSKRNVHASKQVATNSDKSIQGKNYSYRKTSFAVNSNNEDKKNRLLVNLDKPKAMKTFERLVSDPGENARKQQHDVIKRKASRYHTNKQSSKTAEIQDDNNVIFRRRSNSYCMAVDPFEVNVRLKPNNTVLRTQKRSESGESSDSYVRKTVTKFENNSKCEDTIELRRKVQNGVRDNIDNLFKNYHRKVKVGASKKEEIEKLSQEINEIIQNSVKTTNKSVRNGEVEEKASGAVISDDIVVERHEVEDITLIYHKEIEPDITDYFTETHKNVSEKVVLQNETKCYDNIPTIIETRTVIADKRNTIEDIEKLILEEIAKNEAVSTDKIDTEETQYVVYLQEDDAGQENARNIFEYWKMMQSNEEQQRKEIDERIVKHLSNRNSFISVKNYALEISDTGEETTKNIVEIVKEDIGSCGLNTSEENRVEDFKEEEHNSSNDENMDLKTFNYENVEFQKELNLSNEENMDLKNSCDYEDLEFSEEELNLNQEETTDLRNSFEFETLGQEEEDIIVEESNEHCVPKEDFVNGSDSDQTSSFEFELPSAPVLTNFVEPEEVSDSDETSSYKFEIIPSVPVLINTIELEQNASPESTQHLAKYTGIKPLQNQLKMDEYSNKMETKLEDISPNMSGEKRISFLYSNMSSNCSESDGFTDIPPRNSRLYGGSFKGRAIVSEKVNENIKQSTDVEESLEDEMERLRVLNSRLFNGSFKGRALVSVKVVDKGIASHVGTLSRNCSIDSNGSEFDKSINYNNLVRNSVYRKSFRRKSTAKTEEEIKDVAINLTKNDSMKSNDSTSTTRSRRSKLYNLFRSTSKAKNKDPNNNPDDSLFEEPLTKSHPAEIDNLFTDSEPADDKTVDAYNRSPLLKEFYTRAWVQSVTENLEEDVTLRPTSKKNTRENGSEGTKEESAKVLNSWTVFDECNNPAIRLSVYEGFEGVFNLGDKKEDKKIEEPEKELRRSIDEMKDNSQKACLIGELRATEENYVDRSLRRLVFDYMPVMDMNEQDVPPSLIGKSRIIFGNADILYQKHKHKFLPCLLNCRTIEDVGECFLKHESIFKLYPLYSKNKPKSENMMRLCGPYFKIRQEELKDRLDLSSYLLTPIQRMAKYCLIVKALIKECDKEKIPCDTLKKASVMLHKQMQMGNDMIALDSILGYNGNLREQGDLIQRDVFLIMPPNKQHSFDGMVFLFQQSILITSISLQHGMEKFIFKDIINVTDMGYTNNVDEPQIFKVWFRRHDQKQYTLKARNADIHNKWVTEIFNLLWRQLEANKTKRKKELEENGIKVKNVPLQRPASIPNNQRTGPKQSLRTKSSSQNSFKTLKKKPDTTWYERH